MNRAERRRRGIRRGAATSVRLAGIGALIGAGLTTGYVGTYRSSRAEAAIVGTSCAGIEGGGVINDDTTLRSAIANINAGSCNIIDISASITVDGDLPAIAIGTGAAANSLQIIALTDDSVISGDDSYAGLAFLQPGGPTGHAFLLAVTDVTLTHFNSDDTAAIKVDTDDTVVVAIENSTLSHNYARNDAGALDVHSASSANVYLYGTRGVISRNRSQNQPGAIRSSGHVTAYNTYFDHNYTLGYAAGAIAANGWVIVEDSDFYHNQAHLVAGAIQANNVRIAYSTFAANSADDSGGAIFTNTADIADSWFGYNYSGDGGGAIYSTGDVDIAGSSFAHNTANGSGGAVALDPGGRLTIAASGFTSNRAITGGGGAVTAEDLAARSSSFDHNTATGSGGAIYGLYASVERSDFDANSADYGGAIAAFHSTEATLSTFTNNHSLRHGGAIWGYPDLSKVTLRRSSLIDNYAAFNYFGGAVRTGSLYGSYVSFIGNGDDSVGGSATAIGGAAAVDDTISLANSTLYANIAFAGGGALYDDSTSTASITLTFVTAAYNLAVRSSVLMASADTQLTIAGSVFVTDDSTVPFCWDGKNNRELTTPYTPYSYVSDTATNCGIETASLSNLAFTTPLSANAEPGTQVLTPDDSSILVNAVPTSELTSTAKLGNRPNPFYERDLDQLRRDRMTPHLYTSIGAVQVLPEPIITTEPQSVSVPVGASASFTVAATGGSGVLSYRWQSSTNGGATWADVTGNATADDTTLIVPSTSSSDNALRLRAVVSDTNLIATNSTSATLTVTSPSPPSPPTPPSPPVPSAAPSMPQDVIAEPATSSAVVRWTTPTSPGSSAIIEYEVLDDFGSGGCLLPAADTDAFACQVSGLIDGVAYRFKVRARNSVGWGDWSEWTTAVTPEPEPTPSTATIAISGARASRQVTVVGITTGLVSASLQSMVKVKGQSNYQPGSVRVVNDAGSFNWGRKTGKKVYVYFVSDEVRSNRVIIPAK